MNLSNFDGNTIVAAYNAIANNPVKRFTDRKTAERRFLSVAQASGYSDEKVMEILRSHGPEAADGMDQSADMVDEATSPDAPADFIEQYVQPESADEPQTEAEAFEGTIVDDGDVPEFLKGDAYTCKPPMAETVSVKTGREASAKAMADEVIAKTTVAKPAKADKPAKPAKATEAPVEGKKTKNETMLDMAKRPEGATEAEICAVLGWKACLVTLRRATEKAGLKLTSEKQKGGKSRYFAK